MAYKIQRGHCLSTDRAPLSFMTFCLITWLLWKTGNRKYWFELSGTFLIWCIVKKRVDLLFQGPKVTCLSMWSRKYTKQCPHARGVTFMMTLWGIVVWSYTFWHIHHPHLITYFLTGYDKEMLPYPLLNKKFHAVLHYVLLCMDEILKQ